VSKSEYALFRADRKDETDRQINTTPMLYACHYRFSKYNNVLLDKHPPLSTSSSLINTRNPWQSLEYSPLGAAVSPHSR